MNYYSSGLGRSLGHFFGKLSAFQDKSCDRPPVLLSRMRKSSWSVVTLTVRRTYRPNGTTDPIEKYTHDISHLTNRPTFAMIEGKAEPKGHAADAIILLP